MNGIFNTIKDIFMFDKNEKIPVGLCSFEQPQENLIKVNTKQKKRKEMRLSELME